MNQDREHIRLLATLHYVVSGIAALCSLFPVIHLVIGIAMVTGRLPDQKDPELAEWMGWFFILLASGFMAAGFAFAICLALAGRHLSRHRHYRYCLVMGAVACLFMPLGTVLGVFTILVLMKDSVRAMFSGELASGDVR
jgi:hypothetical protein